MSHWFDAVLAVIPALLLAWAVRLLVVARRSSSWPTADATILVSRVVGPRNGTKARIEFAYAVDGHAHVGHRVAVGPAVSTSGSGAARVVAAHPVGSRTTIAYNPNKPSYGVLMPGVRPHHVVLVVAVAAVLVWTIVGAVARPMTAAPITTGAIAPVPDSIAVSRS